MNRYEGDKDRKVLSQFYIGNMDKSLLQVKDNVHPKWFDKKLTEVLKILKHRYFFKRFSINRITEFLNKIEMDVLGKNKILFFEKNKVYVVISGSIQMKNHSKCTELPETLAKIGEGDILNFLQDTSVTFNAIETWFIAQVETEVAIFDKDYFTKVWNQDLMTHDLLLKRSVLQSHPLFSDLSELTVMSLVSEILQTRVFQMGEQIMP